MKFFFTLILIHVAAFPLSTEVNQKYVYKSSGPSYSAPAPLSYESNDIGSNRKLTLLHTNDIHAHLEELLGLKQF